MTSDITGADRFQRRSDLLTTEIDGEVIAMSLDNGACYGLNAIGTRIWKMLDAPITVDAICATLLGEFNVTPDVCRREVTELLGRLRAEGIVGVQAA